jgi:hypothetical protein
MTRASLRSAPGPAKDWDRPRDCTQCAASACLRRQQGDTRTVWPVQAAGKRQDRQPSSLSPAWSRSSRLRRMPPSRGCWIQSSTGREACHGYLILAQSERNVGDYGVGERVAPEDATKLIGWAREFLEAAHQYLSR